MIGNPKARVDNNQAQIVTALRMAGICVTSTAALGKGFPDLVCGFRGINVLLEVKCGTTPSQKTLTAAEREWHDTWGGQVAVVDSADAAIRAVVAAAQAAGKL